MAKDYLQEFENLRRSWSANENNVGPGSATRSPATIAEAKRYYTIVQNQEAINALNGIAPPKKESYEEYFKKRKALEDASTQSNEPGFSRDVDFGDPAEYTEDNNDVQVKDSSLNEEANNKKTPYELALEQYNKELSDYDAKYAEISNYSKKLSEDVDAKRAIYLSSNPKTSSAEIRSNLEALKKAIDAGTQYALSTNNSIGPSPKKPNQKDFENLINKTIDNNNQDDLPEPKSPEPKPPTRKDFENLINKTIDNNNNQNDLIAGYDQSGNAGYGDPYNIKWPKSGTPGPGYKAPEPKPPPKTASSETPESRYEDFVAQVKPGPSGYQDPRSYDPRGIIPVITPGSKFKSGEGYNLIEPFKNSPQTGPGLSETPEKTYENFVAQTTPQTSPVNKDETLTKYEGLLTQLKKSKDTQKESKSSSTEEFSNTVGLLNELNAFESLPEENSSVLIADTQSGRLSDKLPPNIRDARNWARDNPGKYNPFLPDNVNRYFMGVPKQV